jgi:SNF2 family DNA or RNA helicase
MEASQIAKLPNPDLKKVLLYLYGYQTFEEQVSESTVESNGVGFNMIDAVLLSSFAEQVKAGRELSEKQYTRMRLMLPKYHNQLSEDIWSKIVLPEVTYTNGSKTSGTQELVDRILKEAQTNPHHPVNVDYAKIERMAPKTAGRLWLNENGALAFTPNVYPSRQIKEIGFTKWDGSTKTWSQFTPKVYPQIVDQVRKLFGEIEVDPAVTEAFQPQAPVGIDLDWLNKEYPSLKDFQKEAIEFTANHPRLLLALAPRLGKTVVTVIAANVVDAQKILVVAPLSLLRDWRKKIKTWCHTNEEPAIVYKKNILVGARWTITNYDTLRLHPDTFNRTNWDLIIVDETLLIKNRKAQRTQWVYELVNKKLPYSKRKEKEAAGEKQVSVFAGKAKPPKYVWFLSGAPTSKLYTDMWAQLNILDPNQFTSYWRFAENYCINQPSQWTKYNIVANQPDAADRIKKDLGHIFYTRSHTDVTDLPAMEPENLGIPMNSYQEKLYNQMENKFLAELSENDTVIAPIVLAQILRLVQIASNPLLIGGRDESAKWDALIEMLDFEEVPIIVWTSFIDTVEGLSLRLARKERRIARLTGATPQDERGQIVEDFQAGNIHTLIAHPAVGKYGLDLYNAKSVIYLERGYNADDYYQSMMRVRYLNQTEAPRMVHLLSERKDGQESIDHVIDQLLASRTDATKKLTTVGLKQMMGVLK